MARNGSGVYAPPATDYPAVASTLIESAKYNNVVDDIATALTGSIAADGQTTITANLPMNSKKLTGLAAGATAGDSVRFEQLTKESIVGITTADSPQFTGINLGHASDTTITRASAGTIAVEGVNVLTTATGAALAGSVSQAFSVASLEVGNASDTTITRASAGTIAVEGVNILTTATGAEIAGDTFTGDSGQTVTGASTRFRLTHYRNAAATPNVGFSINASRGSSGVFSALQSGDALGYYMAGGDDGASLLSNKANMTILAAENWGVGSNGTHLTLSTTPTGSATLAEGCRLTSAGNFCVGSSNPTFDLGTGLAVERTGGNASVYVNRLSATTPGGVTLFSGDTVNGVYGTGTKNLQFYTNASEKLRITSGGDVTVSTAALLGYGTGAGGTVTQTTSKSTAVTLNKPCGQITMDAAALTGGSSPTYVNFTLNNSLIAATDNISVEHSSAGGTSAAYTIDALTVSAGAVVIRVGNISGGSLSEALVINFGVNKRVTS